LGTAFLFVFALRSFYRAYRPQTLAGTDVHGAQTSMGAAIGTALLLTFLNPHVYLDTVLVLGGIASRFDGWDRALFAGGAMLASALWFYPLGFGAKKLRKYMNRPMTWRVIDNVIGALMLILSVSLAVAAWRRDF
jgi:L-lysine exporter family protein LysE/ArgO